MFNIHSISVVQLLLGLPIEYKLHFMQYLDRIPPWELYEHIGLHYDEYGLLIWHLIKYSCWRSYVVLELDHQLGTWAMSLKFKKSAQYT